MMAPDESRRCQTRYYEYRKRAGIQKPNIDFPPSVNLVTLFFFSFLFFLNLSLVSVRSEI